jgi:cytochrome c-type biogenesis protein CcmH/NrfF
VLVAARHVTPTSCTLRDKQTRFSERTKSKKNKNKNIPDSNSNLAMSMTHHNQTK